MLNISKCIYSLILEKPIATGYSADYEGAPLVSVLENGEEKVKPCEGAADEKFVGVCYRRSSSMEIMPWVEEAVVPSSSPYQLYLQHSNLVEGEIRIYDKTDGKDLTLGDPTNAGEYSVDINNGVVTFNSAQAGHEVVIYYRYRPTLAEVKSVYYEEAVGMNAAGTYGRTAIIVPPCEVYTTEYDITKDWSNATDIRLGANGKFTVGGTGTKINARVVKVPTAGDPYLGLFIMG